MTLTGLLVTGLMLVIACGGSTPEAELPTDTSLPKAGESVGGSDEGIGSPDIELDIADFNFTQPNITVPVGTRVIWHNQDSAGHTVTTVEPLFASGTVSRDGNFSFTFEEPGTYEYYCSIHPYMTGTVIVE